MPSPTFHLPLHPASFLNLVTVIEYLKFPAGGAGIVFSAAAQHTCKSNIQARERLAQVDLFMVSPLKFQLIAQMQQLYFFKVYRSRLKKSKQTDHR